MVRLPDLRERGREEAGPVGAAVRKPVRTVQETGPIALIIYQRGWECKNRKPGKTDRRTPDTVQRVRTGSHSEIPFPKTVQKAMSFDVSGWLSPVAVPA